MKFNQPLYHNKALANARRRTILKKNMKKEKVAFGAILAS